MHQLLYLIIEARPPLETDYTVNDDGVVRVYYGARPAYFTYPAEPAWESFVKACLQGQVYRPEEKDCRGSGTEENNWGVSKFQFCETNDRACENSFEAQNYTAYEADSARSPVGAACAGDGTRGLSWKLKVFRGIDMPTSHFSRPFLEDLSGDTDFFWQSPFSSQVEKARVFTAVSVNGDLYNVESRLKTEQGFVWCETEKTVVE